MVGRPSNLFFQPLRSTSSSIQSLFSVIEIDILIICPYCDFYSDREPWSLFQQYVMIFIWAHIPAVYCCRAFYFIHVTRFFQQCAILGRAVLGHSFWAVPCWANQYSSNLDVLDMDNDLSFKILSVLNHALYCHAVQATGMSNRLIRHFSFGHPLTSSVIRNKHSSNQAIRKWSFLNWGIIFIHSPTQRGGLRDQWYPGIHWESIKTFIEMISVHSLLRLYVYI